MVGERPGEHQTKERTYLPIVESGRMLHNKWGRLADAAQSDFEHDGDDDAMFGISLLFWGEQVTCSACLCVALAWWGEDRGA